MRSPRKPASGGRIPPLLALLLVLGPLAGGGARAEEPAEELPPAFAGEAEEGPAPLARPLAPWRLLATAGAGLSVRVLVEDRFQQERLAPAFAELSGGAVAPWTLGAWRPWFGLSLALGLGRDGTVASGVGPGEQLVLAPSVRALRPLRSGPVLDGWLWAGLALPVAVTPALSPGLELSGGAAWLLRAGLGGYVEATAGLWAGGAPAGRLDGFTLHPVLSIEAGVLLDWEVLP